MAQALCDSVATMEEQTQKLERLRKRLLDGLQDVEGMWLNGHLESRIPGIVNLGFEDVSGETLDLRRLTVLAVATSIDALSVGFTISEYGWFMALVCSLIVAIVTFFICEAGLAIGKKFGTELSGKASVLGGVILIGIGLEIFMSGMMG